MPTSVTKGGRDFAPKFCKCQNWVTQAIVLAVPYLLVPVFKIVTDR
jgi:hypothetical protein